MVFVGIMLALFLVLTMMLLGIAGNATGPSNNGAVFTANNGMQSANARMNSVSAFNLAESGVEYTLQWLHTQAAPPTNTSAFAPALWGGVATGDREIVTVYDANDNPVGTFSVKIYPDSGNNVPPGSTYTVSGTVNKYMIESEGNSGGFTQIVEAYVQQKSFSNYSYFTNTEWSNGYWVSGINTFNGPMHSNSVDVYNPSNPTPIPTNILWYDNQSTVPMFNYDGPDAFSAAANSVAWQDDSIGNFQAPQTESQWLNVAVGGPGSITTGTGIVALPQNTNEQASAALGAASVPATTGVVVPNDGKNTTGGVYVHGIVNNMKLSAPQPTTQEIEIDQTQANGNPLQTLVTENLATNVTTVVVNTTQSNGAVTMTSSSYSGVTDGSVYADSQIGQNTYPGQGLSGVVANNYVNPATNTVTPNNLTISTSLNQNMYLNGSVTLLTQRQQDSNGNSIPEDQDSNYTQNAGTVGILSNNVIIDDNNAANQTLMNEQVDASVIAVDSFYPVTYWNGLRGTFTVNGGYIAGTGGIFGEIDWSGDMLSGFREHYNFDPRLVKNPPAYFPTTGAQYDIDSWMKVPKLIE
jgi:hypothetical protein